MREIFALVAALMLLAGCATVSKESYDQLKASCDADKKKLSDQLIDEKAKYSGAQARISECIATKDAALAQLGEEKSANAKLRADVGILDEAKSRLAEIDKYELAKEYYDEAYGPGRAPNSARLAKIDAQVTLTGDGAFKALWENVRNCQTLTGCNNAKLEFNSYVQGKALGISVDAANFIRESMNQTQ